MSTCRQVPKHAPFTAIEQCAVKAGRSQINGVAENLSALLDEKCKAKGLGAVTEERACCQKPSAY